MSENRVLGIISGPGAGRRKLNNEDIHNLYFSPNIKAWPYQEGQYGQGM
jgi:hypothetical protein